MFQATLRFDGFLTHVQPMCFESFQKGSSQTIWRTYPSLRLFVTGQLEENLVMVNLSRTHTHKRVQTDIRVLDLMRVGFNTFRLRTNEIFSQMISHCMSWILLEAKHEYVPCCVFIFSLV